MSKKAAITALLLLLIIPSSSLALTTARGNGKPVPDVLNPTLRIKDPPQFELAAYGGSYLGNTLGQTWTAGVKAFAHMDSTWAFGAHYGYAELLTDRATRFGMQLTDSNLDIVDAQAMISNDVAMRVGSSLMEIDFYLTLGVGAIQINDQWQPVGVIGGGAKFYTPVKWLAFRVDVDNYAHYTDMVGNDNFDFDVTFTGGISLLFPAKK
jgi:outer membrane beta-barrel protein